MAEQYGTGLIKTTSGRTTYAPDGLASSSLAAEQLSGMDQLRYPGARRSTSISGTTTAHSRSGSVAAEDFDEKNAEDESEKKHKLPRNLSKDGLPVGATAGLNEGNFSTDADVEMQRDLEERRKEEDSDKDPNLVEWDGPDDPGNPMNFPEWKKWVITVASGLMTFTVTFASSVFSTATNVTAEIFGVSSEVMILGTSLFVLGFAFGPIVWGPLSELYGRKLPLFFGFFVFAIFQIPVAVAQNLQTIFLCRFFGGFFASAPLAIIGGLLADMFGPIDRGIAVAVFSGATFIGPVAGPIVGGFITMSYLGWRWTSYITAIMAFFFGAVGFLLIPETFAPVLLQARAKKIRYATKNWAIHAEADETQVDLKELTNTYILRPFSMLVSEPILLLITLYMSFIYGFLYLCFEAYPTAFQQLRGWNAGVGALPFLSITVGVVIGAVYIAIYSKTRFAKKLEANDGNPVPEERLIPMMVGGVLLPAGLFWFAWTSNPHITWVPEVLSGIFIGAGVLLIFLQGLNYIIDVYATNANSAIAANTFMRSLLGAAFPLFATYMFQNLGMDWGMSLLGFLTAALAPVPVLFYFFGSRIRKASKYSPGN